ncbi:MAG: hypothetical protein E6G68_03160 [Actinobacteria bacterium]|nr:MAG: hypothetical protein E6G68_03160 [Actinomycetota bacterium]
MLSLILQSPAGAEPRRHVYILWVDATTLSDWSKPSLSNFAQLFAGASLALLSTRTENESLDPATLRANAAVTFGAGSRSGADPVTDKPLPFAGVRPGILGDALTQAGHRTLIIGDADGADGRDRSTRLALSTSRGVVPPEFAISVRDASFPQGLVSSPELIARTISSARPSYDVILIDPGDTERVERSNETTHRDKDLARAMHHVDAVLGVVTRLLEPSDSLIVVSATNSVSRQRRGIRLGVVAIQGPGYSAGLLRSGTTRRSGVISVIDLAPTIAAMYDLSLNGVQGRIASSISAGEAAAKLTRFEREILDSWLFRRGLTRGLLVEGMFAAALGLMVLRPKTKPTPNRRRLRRLVREAALTLLITATATPLSLYVLGAFHPSSLLVAASEAFALALATALLLRATVGTTRSLATLLVLSAGVPLIDIIVGDPLGVRSPLGAQIVVGARFFGAGGDVLGIVVGAELAAVALLASPHPTRRRGMRTAVMASLFVVTTWVLSAPSLGSKFGAVFTAVPAFAVITIFLAGGRPTKRSVIWVGLATLSVALIVVAADALRSHQQQSHIAPAFGNPGSLHAVVLRKLLADWRLATHTLWLPAIAVFAGSVALAYRWRSGAATSALGSPSTLPGALTATVIAGLAALAFNDTGVVTATPIALYGAAVTLAVFISADSSLTTSSEQGSDRSSARA